MTDAPAPVTLTLEDFMAFSLGDLAKGYLRLKDGITALDREHAERMKPDREKLELVLKAMGKKLTEMGVRSAGTDVGTPYLSTIETVKVESWEDFAAFVEEQGETDMLVRSVNKTKVLEYRDKHRNLPPGVSTNAITNINFTRK